MRGYQMRLRIIMACWVAVASICGTHAQIPSGEPVVLNLDHPYTTSVLGGRGRYLLLHAEKASTLYVLDLQEQRVAAALPGVVAGTRIAAGADHFVLVIPEQRLIQRWSFQTMQRDKVARLDRPEKIHRVVLGASATGQGPILIGGSEGVLIDLNPLQPIPATTKIIGGTDGHDYDL